MKTAIVYDSGEIRVTVGDITYISEVRRRTNLKGEKVWEFNSSEMDMPTDPQEREVMLVTQLEMCKELRRLK